MSGAAATSGPDDGAETGAARTVRPAAERPPFSRLPSARSVLRACLALQVLVAGALVLESGWGVVERAGRPGITTAPAEPVTPGDQRRPYSPATVPRVERPADRRGLPIPLPDDLPSRLTFEMQDAPPFGRVLMATGEIDDAAAGRFRAMVESLPEPPDAVALHSPGGRVTQAIAIGRIIREHELDTLVPPGAACLSACPYILAGGVERTASRSAWIGVHQHSYDASVVLPAFMAVEQIQMGQGEVLSHLDAMGVDPMMLVHGLQTPPQDMYVLVEEELDRYRLATRMVD